MARQLRLQILACFVGIAAPSYAGADEELIQEVRKNHKAARESIRTFSSTIIQEQTHPEKGRTAQARYSRSGRTARIQEGQEGTQDSVSLMKGGEIWQVSRSWSGSAKAPKALTIRKPGDTNFGMCDVWREMLIEMTGPAGKQLDLERCLESADGPIRADLDKLDGRRCVRLRYFELYPTGAKTRVTQWHEISRNYLIVKMVIEYPEDPSSFRDVIELTEFVEPSPGVVFPVVAQRQHYKKGELFQSRVTRLTNVEINKPLAASELALPSVPRGTALRDYIENKEGPVDSALKPIGSMRALSPRPVPAAESAPPAKPLDVMPSTSEPVTPGRFVIACSLGILVVATGVALARRSRTRRHSVDEVSP